MRATRTFARLVWFHVPLRLGPKPQNNSSTEEVKPANKAEEIRRMMAEKRMALDLLQGWVTFMSLMCASSSFRMSGSLSL